jgi:hypothetical protein
MLGKHQDGQKTELSLLSIVAQKIKTADEAIVDSCSNYLNKAITLRPGFQ